MFWKKKDEGLNKNSNAISSDEYGKCLTRFAELHSEFTILKTEVKALQTDVDNLRGRFNSRLKGLKTEEEKAEDKKTETINNSEFIAFG